ncbi:unnamed protein product, partial [marine sediment metagenome]
DLSGNVFLEYEDLYIERIGFPNRFPEERRGRGPFSDKASLILRAIFPNKEKLWGVRELAQSVNLNPGFVSRMARELEKRNYVVFELFNYFKFDFHCCLLSYCCPFGQHNK